MGSAGELEYYLLLGRDLGFLETFNYAQLNYEQLTREIPEINRMLTGIIQRLSE